MTQPSLVTSGERLCAQAMRWLWEARRHFVLPPSVSSVDLVDVQTFKTLSELALAGWVVRREGAAGSDTRKGACDLLDFVWEQFHRGDLLHRMLLRNPAATHPIEVYSTLYAAGYRHEGLHQLIRHLLTLRSYRALDLVPNRKLGVAAAIRRLGLTPWADDAELLAGTWLGGLPEPWMIDTYNAYSVTHTVFHLTDHGAAPDRIPTELGDYLRRWLPVWLDVYAEAGFWDLLGELLIVHGYLDDPDEDPAPWQRFVQAQHDDGMMPNGINQPTPDPVARALTHYHPTVVAAIAGTLAVSRGLAAVSPDGNGTR
ncbi:DUF6895 family protein [Amycolatopsis arida]|nr:hypothetical protein [Amycolatopsis arida]